MSKVILLWIWEKKILSMRAFVPPPLPTIWLMAFDLTQKRKIVFEYTLNQFLDSIHIMTSLMRISHQPIKHNYESGNLCSKIHPISLLNKNSTVWEIAFRERRAVITPVRHCLCSCQSFLNYPGGKENAPYENSFISFLGWLTKRAFFFRRATTRFPRMSFPRILRSRYIICGELYCNGDYENRMGQCCFVRKFGFP